MMMTRSIELACWGAATMLALAAAAGWHRAVPLAPADAAKVLRTPDPNRVIYGADSLTRMGERVVAHDPFRLGRRPSEVAYKPEPEGLPPPAPGSPRPALRLTGILGGPPWRAVLDGVPGREGSVVVRSGDVLDKLRIGTVKRDTVIITGMDTTWKLTMTRPW
jgi:hypothetical protein